MRPVHQKLFTRAVLSEAEFAFVRAGIASGEKVHRLAIALHRDHRIVKRWLEENGIEWRVRAPVRAVVPPKPDRTEEPLPAGHPLTWGLINQGLSIAGCPFNREIHDLRH